jgi:hypothetical protein
MASLNTETKGLRMGYKYECGFGEEFCSLFRMIFIAIILVTLVLLTLNMARLVVPESFTDMDGMFVWEPNFWDNSKKRDMFNKQRSPPFVTCDGGCSANDKGCGCKEVQSVLA